MKQVAFGTLPVGAEFTLNNQKWTKINKIKVSCCKFYNAESVFSAGTKSGIRDDQMVEVEE